MHCISYRVRSRPWSKMLHLAAGWLVASSSSPAAPASLHVAMLPHSGDGGGANPSGPLSWAPVATADPVPFQPAVDSALQDIVVETLQVALPYLSSKMASCRRFCCRCQEHKGCLGVRMFGNRVQHMKGAASATLWQATHLDHVASVFPAHSNAAADLCVPHADVQLRPAHPQTGGDVPFEAIVVRPRGTDEPLPTILLPHGGPHSAYVAGYALPTGYLPALGYAVLAVNFRGSTGFGEACVQSLPGHAGSADVADCMQALQAAVDKSAAALDILLSGAQPGSARWPAVALQLTLRWRRWCSQHEYC